MTDPIENTEPHFFGEKPAYQYIIYIGSLTELFFKFSDDEGDNFTIEVDLGRAVAFSSYEMIESEVFFVFSPNADSIEFRSTVTITVTEDLTKEPLTIISSFLVNL